MHKQYTWLSLFKLTASLRHGWVIKCHGFICIYLICLANLFGKGGFHKKLSCYDITGWWLRFIVRHRIAHFRQEKGLAIWAQRGDFFFFLRPLVEIKQLQKKWINGGIANIKHMLTKIKKNPFPSCVYTWIYTYMLHADCTIDNNYATIMYAYMYTEDLAA